MQRWLNTIPIHASLIGVPQWSWDPKETWSLITWLVYAFFLHARLMKGWIGKKVAVVAVIGFIAVVFTYLGVNLFLSGLHSYGELK